MKIFKKSLLFVLILSVSLSLFSCSEEENNREYNEAEVISAARELIEKSLTLNEIIYGKGIGYVDDGTSLIYKKADEESLNEYGVHSISDIREMISEVFSSKYIESIEKSDIFTPLVEDEETVGYARYFEEENEEKTELFVNSAYDYALKNHYEYIGSLSAVGSSGEYVTVRATVRATRSDGTVRDFTKDIKLIEESAGWRLASSTYVVYNEYTDIYEEMNK